jgi:hypothetical protein
MDINWICKLHVLVAVGLESNAMQQWLSDQDIVKIALKTDLDDAFGDQSTERRQLHFVIIDSLSVRLARLCKLKEATAFHN